MVSQVISVPLIVQRIVKSVSCLMKLQVKFIASPNSTDKVVLAREERTERERGRERE